MQQDLAKIKKRARPILKEAGVTRSAVFGSITSGEVKESSDVDILVEMPKNKSLLDFIELQLKLEEALGRKVDLVEYSTIKPRLKPYILNSQIPIL